MNTSTPIPPIQFEKLRHMSMHFGSSSTVMLTEPKILAPVVVNPDTVSKSASTNELVTPENIKGSEPKRLRNIHERATITKPSRE